MQLDKIDEILKIANSLFKWRFRFVIIQKFCYHGNVAYRPLLSIAGWICAWQRISDISNKRHKLQVLSVSRETNQSKPHVCMFLLILSGCNESNKFNKPANHLLLELTCRNEKPFSANGHTTKTLTLNSKAFQRLAWISDDYFESFE